MTDYSTERLCFLLVINVSLDSVFSRTGYRNTIGEDNQSYKPYIRGNMCPSRSSRGNILKVILNKITSEEIF